MTSELNEKPEQYQQALDLAERREFGEALKVILSYLEKSPGDAEALNDAGTILWCQGRSEEAVAYLEKAKNAHSESPEILWNLFESYLSLGMGQDAVKLIDEMDRLGILHVDILNRAAKNLIDSGELEDALAVLKRSLALEPRQSILEPMIEVVHHKIKAKKTTVV